MAKRRKSRKLSGSPAEHAEMADEFLYSVKNAAKRLKYKSKGKLRSAPACAELLYEIRNYEGDLARYVQEAKGSGLKTFAANQEKYGKVSATAAMMLRKKCFSPSLKGPLSGLRSRRK